MGLWFESWKLALDALKANKLRTFLTLLGNIIGVMFVIAILSITQGMNQYVAEKLLDQGSNKFWVERVGMVTSWDEWIEKRNRPEFEPSDLRAIRANAESVGEVGAARVRRERLKRGNRMVKGMQIIGVTEGHPEAIKYPLEAGRHIAPPDIDSRRFVAVIGHTVRNELFPGEDALGKDMRIGANYYTVIGIVERQGNVLGESRDDFVAIPLTAYESQFGTEDDLGFTVQAVDQGTYVTAQDEVRSILRVQRKLKPQQDDNFDIMTAEMFMQIYNNFTAGAYMAMVVLAGIALVVGGIVIMNIMLVSVTERTREIGIRKAIGARRRDILRQFLIEAAVMGLAGGLLGVLAGAGLAKAVEAASPLPAVIQPWACLLGLSVASGVGLFFGIWPAMKAARLDPIVALRFE
jgi:putative ABC transport system permease protein